MLDGDGLAEFAPVPFTDGYVNVAIPPAGAPYAAPFALDELRSLPREQRPFRRRYTVRRWDAAARRLTLEIVVHSDTGAGGPWVAGADQGDALVFTGPAGAYRPDPQADWHLMVGDESALPAIAASLEAVPAGARARVRPRRGGRDAGRAPASARRPRRGSRPALLLALLAPWHDRRGLARDQGGLERRGRARRRLSARSISSRRTERLARRLRSRPQ
jgi:Siderophore-interacting FAD-binding domain/Siderophore-interacting protein